MRFLHKKSREREGEKSFISSLLWWKRKRDEKETERDITAKTKRNKKKNRYRTKRKVKKSDRKEENIKLQNLIVTDDKVALVYN